MLFNAPFSSSALLLLLASTDFTEVMTPEQNLPGGRKRRLQRTVRRSGDTTRWTNRADAEMAVTVGDARRHRMNSLPSANTDSSKVSLDSEALRIGPVVVVPGDARVGGHRHALEEDAEVDEEDEWIEQVNRQLHESGTPISAGFEEVERDRNRPRRAVEVASEVRRERKAQATRADGKGEIECILHTYLQYYCRPTLLRDVNEYYLIMLYVLVCSSESVVADGVESLRKIWSKIIPLADYGKEDILSILSGRVSFRGGLFVPTYVYMVYDTYIFHLAGASGNECLIMFRRLGRDQ